MDDLIKALTIFMKYLDDKNDAVINCEHDAMYVCIDADLVSAEDIDELEKLSFSVDENDTFKSHRFGSC